MRWHSSIVVALALSGCGFSPGSYWAQLHTDLEATFAPRPSRLDAEDRLLTPSSYALRIDDLRLAFDALVVRLATSGAETATFDPADPPPGYSLCHNGHCHADDGRLVDYETIAAELAVGGAGGTSLTQIFDGDPVPLGDMPVRLTPAACPGDCALDRGPLWLTVAELSTAELTFAARVFDQRAGDARRLPSEWIDVYGTVPLPVTYTAAIDYHGEVERHRRPAVNLSLTFDLAAELFDEVDFGGLATASPPVGPLDVTGAPGVSEALAAGAAIGFTLTGTVTRSDSPDAP
jgi:hypothetical protein